MRLTIHRGTNQIGGNCIEITTETTRILLDVGLPLDFEKKTIEEKRAIREKARFWCKGVAAIFISHYHQDHHGLLEVASPDIPIYMTRGTEKMFGINAVFMKPYLKPLGPLRIIEPTRPVKDKQVSSKVTYLPAQPVKIGDITVTAFSVDHSAYDACAFLIEASGKRLLYAGDIRLHGPKGALYRQLPCTVDYLVLEGTNIERDSSVRKELDVRQDLIDLFNENLDRLNMIWCSGQNIDRLTQIFAAARKTNRVFVVDVYIAAVLKEIHQLNPSIPSPESHGIRVIYTQPTKSAEKAKFYLEMSKFRIRPNEIKQSLGKYVIVVRPTMLKYLKQNLEVPSANIITSIYKEYENDYSDFFSWIDSKGYDRKRLHTSGHADQASLIKLVEFVNPGRIIPIHTEKKLVFQSLLGEKTLVLEDEQTIRL